mmetsp:Transcript_67744/g.177640  ORF Transcript_67744/g.177640 Transcript_67744/m.177640 type:complete len:362 (-) Transcript_67744:58-1143(-)
MAMPTDFWRNEQMLNVFRTKPCQRLAQDGLCEWKSQCQFSHSVDWPRRPPRRYKYSPEICRNLRCAQGVKTGEVQIKSVCPAGLRCLMAHSKEEVLFHPHMFKTILCEEHCAQGNQRNLRSGKRARCHRYYCPFAHGQGELQTSPLTFEQREQYLKAVEIFPAEDCCSACTRHWHPPAATENPNKEANNNNVNNVNNNNVNNSVNNNVNGVHSVNNAIAPPPPAPGLDLPQGSAAAWAAQKFGLPVPPPWRTLSPAVGPLAGYASAAAESYLPLPTHASPAPPPPTAPPSPPPTALQNPWMRQTVRPAPTLHPIDPVTAQSRDMPMFIDLNHDGTTVVGTRERHSKGRLPSGLKEAVYAML